MPEDLLLPKYQFHCPLDYSTESHPPAYGPAVSVPGVELPLPPPDVRRGYAPEDDSGYLEWGKADHDRIVGMVKQYAEYKPEMTILDWGCSSGRVLRHFHDEHKQLGWRLLGTDVQAFLIQWMRQYFPPEFEVTCGMTTRTCPIAIAPWTWFTASPSSRTRNIFGIYGWRSSNAS
jgi:hypothetical protein